LNKNSLFYCDFSFSKEKKNLILLKIEKDLNLEIFMLKIFKKKLLNQERTLQFWRGFELPKLTSKHCLEV
jgi:hypothetical protein